MNATLSMPDAESFMNYSYMDMLSTDVWLYICFCSHRDISGTKCDFSVQVQLRFCLSETSCPQEDHFPPNLCVKVNGKPCNLPVKELWINHKNKSTQQHGIFCPKTPIWRVAGLRSWVPNFHNRKANFSFSFWYSCPSSRVIFLQPKTV